MTLLTNYAHRPPLNLAPPQNLFFCSGPPLQLFWSEIFRSPLTPPPCYHESSAHVCFLEKPYGISEPQDLEKENISIWYNLSKLFFSPVKPHSVQVKRSLK